MTTYKQFIELIERFKVNDYPVFFLGRELLRFDLQKNGTYKGHYGIRKPIGFTAI